MLSDDPHRLGRVHHGSSRRKLMARWTVGLGFGVLAAWVAFTIAGGFAPAWLAVRQLDARWIAAALVFEAASYVLLGAKLRRLIGAEVVSSAEAVELGLVVSGLGLLIPASPAGGIAITAVELRHRGLSGRRIAMVFALAEWFSSRAFLAVCAINLLFVALVEQDPLPDLWPLVTLAALVLVLLELSTRLFDSPRVAERVSQILGRFRSADRRSSVGERRSTGAAWYREVVTVAGTHRHRLALATLTALAMLADVACLWFSLDATGYRVGFDIALLAITVASVSALVPLVPGGLGIAEATIPAVTHHFGVPYEQGLAAALAYRALGTFLPTGAGALALIDLRHRTRRAVQHRVHTDAQDVAPHEPSTLRRP